MLIDWFTVGAQVLNFLVLVWLLKRFLYKPILDAIDAREKRIAEELADADAKRVAAKQERDEFHHKNETFDRQRSELLSKAKEEVSAERQRLLEAAHREAEAQRAKRREALHREQESLANEITRRTRDEVFSIARKTLADLSGATLEERLGAVFVQRLLSLDGETKERLATALEASDAPARLRSAFDLPAEQRTTIQQAIRETFSTEIEVRFETAPDVVSGIELTANGQKVAWSIADYLKSLEEGVGELLQPERTAEPKHEPAT